MRPAVGVFMDKLWTETKPNSKLVNEKAVAPVAQLDRARLS